MSQQESSLKPIGLATEGVLPDANIAIRRAVSILNNHTRLDFPNAHGGWFPGDLRLYDSFPDAYYYVSGRTGHAVSAKVAKVKISGLYWLFPASLSATGVDQVPRNTSIYSVPPNGYAKGDDAPDLVFYTQATGTTPMTFQWEFKWSGQSSWTTILTDTVFPRGDGDVTFLKPWVQYSSFRQQGTGNPVSSAVLGGDAPAGVQTVYSDILLQPTPHKNEYYDAPGHIRCRITNAAGSIFSPSMYCQIKDETSGWFS